MVTLTLANSIIGVSVLAMPFCFQLCGIVCATFMLILSCLITRLVCYYLIKAGVMTKRRTYELLAYHTFGNSGKFLVEVTIIGFLMGTLIAFFVVIGDLGPQIIAEIFRLENNDSLRTVVMTGLALFVALPLGLLRDIDSLSNVSTASFLFYVFLVLKILSEGASSDSNSDRIETLNYWKPSGVLQCVPILAMALSCQTQIFTIYDSLPEPSLQRMNEVVKKAVYLCTAFYFSIGFFGYIAFASQGITGNILMSFGQSWTTQLIKLCFVMSVLFSVPLCIFPCRASLFSLIFKGIHTHHNIHDISTNYIPDGKLRFLTVFILSVTLIIAILIPNIELVLGIVGSTAGCIICIIFPSAMFIRVTSKNTTERILAQFTLAFGICIMVLSTYATLYAVETSKPNPELPKLVMDAEVVFDKHKHGPPEPPELLIPKEETVVKFEPKIPLVKEQVPKHLNIGEPEVGKVMGPQSQPKSSSTNPPVIEVKHVEEKPPIDSIQDKEKEPIESKRESLKYEPPPPPVIPKDMNAQAQLPVLPKSSKNLPESKPKEADDNNKKEEKVENVFAPQEFLKKLEHHEKQQKKLIEEQKQILAELKEHHHQDVLRDNHDEEIKAKSEKKKAIEEKESKVLQDLENIKKEEEKNIKELNSMKKEIIEKFKKEPAPAQPVPKKVDLKSNDVPLAAGAPPSAAIDEVKNLIDSDIKHSLPPIPVSLKKTNIPAPSANVVGKSEEKDDKKVLDNLKLNPERDM